MKSEIIQALRVFPDRLKTPVLSASSYVQDIYEIHLISQRAVYFFTSSGIRFVSDKGFVSLTPSDNVLVPYESELEEITDRASGFSGFLHEKELQEGYITYSGGYRIGICTSGSGEIFSQGKINSLCIRIPDSGKCIFPTDTKDVLCGIKNGLLIAGPPCSGKTTLLRYFARLLSDAGVTGYKKVAVIDERGELSRGEPLGYCTDIIGGKEKSACILHALRLTSPEYIICDEIGTVSETKAILQCLNSGVRFICTMHAGDILSLTRREQFRILFREDVFDRIIFLSDEQPGKILSVLSKEEVRDENFRACPSLLCDSNDRLLSYVPQ